MHITILLPHYTTGPMTAYSIAQLLKLKGGHHMDILVIDNKAGDSSAKYLEPFMKDITIVSYPSDMMQSHGIAFDHVLPFIQTEYFFTMESDSFPTKDNWLDEYQHYKDKNVDAAGSLLKLSGGTYLHPCGAMYKKSVWQEAMDYAKTIPYNYYPNMAMSQGFACHLMVHKSIVNDVLAEPEDYIELAEGYKPYSAAGAEMKRLYYEPTCGVFHNGMGGINESVKTYGARTVESEMGNIILDNKLKLVKRIGFEPGQWFSIYLAAMGMRYVL